MDSYIFAPPVYPAVPVLATPALFPVRRILCVGRNYAAHAREMGGDERDPPFFFAKPADAVVIPGEAVPYPTRTADLHHEVELVVALNRAGEDIDPTVALDLVFGYAV
ncbi:MAG TPA: fumarylacetoacetate hydrolase family protein, partial [Caulobacteraceae bacterium]|nr:fumarylacetoacetate hydrolase family protein [Caulobacteraceae bacterium]